jgi:hypothetical protein
MLSLFVPQQGSPGFKLRLAIPTLEFLGITMAPQVNVETGDPTEPLQAKRAFVG